MVASYHSPPTPGAGLGPRVVQDAVEPRNKEALYNGLGIMNDFLYPSNSKVYVVVNFLSQVIFIFILFKLH